MRGWLASFYGIFPCNNIFNTRGKEHAVRMDATELCTEAMKYQCFMRPYHHTPKLTNRDAYLASVSLMYALVPEISCPDQEGGWLEMDGASHAEVVVPELNHRID